MSDFLGTTLAWPHQIAPKPEYKRKYDMQEI